MIMTNDTLLIFARNPVYGKVKTRLAAAIGNDKALLVYKALLRHTAEVTKSVNADRIVYYSDFITDSDVWDDTHHKAVQQGADLGERMSNAFNETFKGGTKKAVIIGTDCYDLTYAIITDAFTALNNYDVVIGPALDGGYYLLGMQTYRPQLFDNMKWSTDTVSKETLSRCADLGLSHFLLPVLSDIDEQKDLVNTNILNRS